MLVSGRRLHGIRTRAAGVSHDPLPTILVVAVVLVVEDDEGIAEAVAARLRSGGLGVAVVTTGPEAVDWCRRQRPDLVVLDLGLPGLDGLEVCRRIQTDHRTPVVMLTARDEETDVLVGLGVGADDYVTKPFSGRQLLARVQAVLRRVGADRPEALMHVGDVTVDRRTRRVHRGDVEVHLTATEFDLVAHLAAAGGAVVRRERLLDEVWGYRDGGGLRTVDSHVRAVRRKLGDGVIRTVHGVGYAAGAP